MSEVEKDFCLKCGVEIVDGGCWGYCDPCGIPVFDKLIMPTYATPNPALDKALTKIVNVTLQDLLSD